MVSRTGSHKIKKVSKHSTSADVEYPVHEFGDFNTLALVLAGGRGSRLYELTDWRAKPAVPFGGKYKLIDFVLSNCINSGISRIGVITQYKSHSLNQHIQRGWQLYNSGGAASIELLPAQQRTKDQSWYSGTADAIYQNLDIIQAHGPEYVLILSGDHIYKMNYLPMIRRHIESNANVTIGTTHVDKSEATQFGVVEVDGQGLVTRFVEKPEKTELKKLKGKEVQVSMGIYVFNAEFLYKQLIQDHSSAFTENDFGKNLIPGLIADKSVSSFLLEDDNNSGKAYWRDVGTIDSYYKANMELIGVVPSLNIHDSKWPIRTHLNQLAPAKIVFDERCESGTVYNSMISDGSIIIGSDIINSLVSKNVTVCSNSVVEESIVLPDAVIGKNCIINKAIIDKGCIVPDGLIVGGLENYKSDNFRVTDDGITLVTQAMLDSIAPAYEYAA